MPLARRTAGFGILTSIGSEPESKGGRMAEQNRAELSLGELAHRTDQIPETLLHWRSLHLIGEEDRDVFSAEDVDRVRMIRFCLQQGCTIDALVRAEEMERGFLRRYLGEIFPAGIGPAYSLAEAAESAGLDIEFVRRLQEICGAIGVPGRIYDDDVAVLRG